MESSLSDFLIDQVESCKRDIAYYASEAGLKYSTDDIVAVHEEMLGEVVFLTRFNPYEITNEMGDTITKWHETMWYERIDDACTYSLINDTFTYNPGRLVIASPWLVRVIKNNGEIIRRV